MNQAAGSDDRNGGERNYGARTVLVGTPVVPGLAYGPVIFASGAPDYRIDPDARIDEADRAAEAERFTAAVATVADRFAARASASSGTAAEVLTATAALARDRAWIGTAGGLIATGIPAAAATVTAIDKISAMFADRGGLMAERVTDLADIRNRVVAQVLGLPEPGIPLPEVPSVLLADDLAPADTAGLDPARVIALVTRLGGPSSHTAIIARQLGIPCVVAVADLARIDSGTTVFVDGDRGVIGVDPEAGPIAEAVAEARRRAAEVAQWRGPGRTADGHPVQILGNVADGASARSAAALGILEGVGLFRTELAFLERPDEPSVAEQERLYREVIEAMGGAKVVIRTLDAGSDKPLRFVTHPDEDNPAMGVRGNRIVATHPEVRDHQLDALAAAADGAGAPVWVMAPMIATVAEAREFAAQVRGRGLVPGVMVEVPSAAILAEKILAEVDFVSIGTNDLTQYTMAADRMSADLAALTDPWQPAVLALVERVGAAGAATGKPVGVCGEAAADPLLAGVLVGLGVGSLSCAPAAAAAVGRALATVTLDQCAAAAQAAVAADGPAQAREAARAILG